MPQFSDRNHFNFYRSVPRPESNICSMFTRTLATSNAPFMGSAAKGGGQGRWSPPPDFGGKFLNIILTQPPKSWQVGEPGERPHRTQIFKAELLISSGSY